MYRFEPPLINSSNRWATTKEDLEELYACPHTGAITIRTSLAKGFPHDDEVHQHCFFDDSLRTSTAGENFGTTDKTKHLSSLNTLGYSPIPLQQYMDTIVAIEEKHPGIQQKPVIFSVTGTPDEVRSCCIEIGTYEPVGSRWLMEVNLSCPNIPSKPPPAYSSERLQEYLEALHGGVLDEYHVPIGLKTPPYTYQGQFDALIGALDASAAEKPCPVSFITATNTLGSCFLPSGDFGESAINSASGTGIGAMAGAALHPLALGNVKTIRRMLDERPALKKIEIIGTGGVLDHAGYRRMRAAGAAAVGVGTGLGVYGVGVFEKILGGEGSGAGTTPRA
ncbi:dihydroorotate dehydrogenase [Thelotrema lepadinum]|nr:dihydroorotate dehydrogenase [Thelotrema lepadinum]